MLEAVYLPMANDTVQVKGREQAREAAAVVTVVEVAVVVTEVLAETVMVRWAVALMVRSLSR